MTDVVVCSTVLDETAARNAAAARRLKELCADPAKRFFVFSNEHHKETYVEKKPGESPNDRNDRAIRHVAAFYKKLLDSQKAQDGKSLAALQQPTALSPPSAASPPPSSSSAVLSPLSSGLPRPVLLSDDAASRQLAAAAGVDALSTMAYARARASDAPGLADLVAASKEEERKSRLEERKAQGLDASEDDAATEAGAPKRPRSAQGARAGGRGSGAAEKGAASDATDGGGGSGGVLSAPSSASTPASSSSSRRASSRRASFPEHLSRALLTQGLRDGRFVQGTLRTSRFSRTEARVASDALDADVRVEGSLHMNRATDGDTVVVEILRKDEGDLGDKGGKGKSKGKGTDTVSDDPSNGEERPAHVATLDPEEDAGRGLGGPAGDAPRGRVVGILKRAWRERGYAASLLPPKEDLAAGAKAGTAAAHQQTPGSSSASASASGSASASASALSPPPPSTASSPSAWRDGAPIAVLAIPVDRRLPAVRLVTRQARSLRDQRIVISLDGWPADSEHPQGHYVRSLGAIGDREAETNVVLHEHDVNAAPFSAAVRACVPAVPWKVSEADLSEPGRRDLRSLVVCSVDPPGCRDVDDALHAREIFFDQLGDDVKDAVHASLLQLQRDEEREGGEGGKKGRGEELERGASGTEASMDVEAAETGAEEDAMDADEPADPTDGPARGSSAAPSPSTASKAAAQQRPRSASAYLSSTVPLTEVGVHIADVTKFVRPHTALDAEAATRCTTTYLVDRRIDMLPKELTEDICSLVGNVDRLAVSCLMVVHPPSARILGYSFTRSVIRSRAQLSYAEAQARMDDAGTHDEITVGLRELNRLARLLRAARFAAGALELASPEVKFSLEEGTNDPLDVGVYQLREANSMVEEWMLAANGRAAELSLRAFAACALLRRHPAPPPRQFDPLLRAARAVEVELDVSSSAALNKTLSKAENPNDPLFLKLLRVQATRCMTQAQYVGSADAATEQERWHYGLATALYTHFTSPIRRYADVVVHRLVLAAIGQDREGLPESLRAPDGVRDQADRLNERHRAAQLAGRASVDLYTLAFFGKREPRAADARVTAVRGRGELVVFVPKYGIEGVVRLEDAKGNEAEEEEEETKEERTSNVSSASRLSALFPGVSSPSAPFSYDEERQSVFDSRGQRLVRVFDKCAVKVAVQEGVGGRRWLQLQLVERSRIPKDELVAE